MSPDDAFLARLQATIASLRYWVPTIADTARVEELDTPDSWKLASTPNASAACPFELLLRGDQRYDILIAGEAFEDLPIDSLDMFVPLVEAIADGRVVQRAASSAATGTEYWIETAISFRSGEQWCQRRITAPLAPGAEEADLIVTERHFLPYRR
jgi:hypothetical protein